MTDQALTLLIGSNIARYRRAAGLTQEQLAEAIGVTPAFISRVECGKKNMKIGTLIATANALRVSVDALVRQESSHASFSNIHQLLKDVPDAYLQGIEAIARICVEKFDPK